MTSGGRHVPGERFDLSDAYVTGSGLSGADLHAANLSGAKLRVASLQGVNLRGSNLRGAEMRGPDLREVDLLGADLTGADLCGANLTGANLSGAILSEANLQRAHMVNAQARGAHLRGANLRGATLYGADLAGIHAFQADLSGANLSRSDLSMAFLSNTDLSNANLAKTEMSYARLGKTNLSNANLSAVNLYMGRLDEADLSNIDLRGAQLNRVSLSGTELTGAKLYGIARDDWKIEGVQCRYVFWDAEGKERSPRDRDLEPGEFERLYAQMPTIEYVFENGMTPLDPLIMDRIVQAINERNPEFELQVDSINASGIYPTIKFSLRHEEQKAAALEAITQGYQLEYAKLQGKYEELRELIYRMIDRPGNTPISIGSNSMVAIGGSSINIQEYINHLEEIEQAIKEASSDTLPEVARREALDTVSRAFKDVARGKVKEAADAIVGLGVRLGPRVASSGAFQFFKDVAG